MQLILATAALFAGLALAQDLSAINGLPNCGKTCINNMLNLAPSLGCANNNITCLCTNMNFGYGVRDCSAAACPPGTDLNMINTVGSSFCQQALAAASGGTGSTATAITTVASGTATVFSATTAVSGVTGPSTGITGTNSTSGGSSSSKAISPTGSINSTSSGNSTTATVHTTTNSAGSTVLSTASSSTAAGSTTSSSGSGTTTSSSSAPTSSKHSEATQVKVAAAGFLGFAGLAACALL